MPTLPPPVSRAWMDSPSAFPASCALHCLVTAIAIGLLSSVASVLEAPIIHEAGLAIAMILGALALGNGAAASTACCPQSPSAALASASWRVRSACRMAMPVRTAYVSARRVAARLRSRAQSPLFLVIATAA